MEEKKETRGRKPGSKNNTIKAGDKKYQSGQQEAYYRLDVGKESIWYTDGYKALIDWEQQEAGALYVGRKTSAMIRLR